MLLQLPQEIVIDIARCLNLYAKLNLAKTCRKLYTLLYNTVLFEELAVPRSCMHQILQLIKDKRLDGSKVKLCYFECLPDNQFSTELQIIFPNLINPIAHESYPQDLSPLLSTISGGFRIHYELCKIMHHSIPLKSIPKYQFKNLKRLTLFEFDELFQYTTNYLHRLRNFTSLKSLILHKFSVSIHALETVHANCIGLEHFEMFPTRSVLVDSRSDHLIEPADHLKSIKVVGGSGTFFLNQSFLEYVIQKYPNLKAFKFYLKDGIHHENMNQVANIGSSSILPTLMTKLVDQIQSFHIDSCLFEYIMNRVDLAPTNIRDLGFYHWDPVHLKLFEAMKVFSFIQSLNSLTLLSLPLSQALKLYNDPIILPNLKHLFLGDKYDKQYGCLTLKLDKLLHIYQSLESLEINHFRSTISLDCINSSKYLSLNSLEFNVGRIEPQITKFIKDSLPNVHYFKLITHGIQDEIIFDFPEHTFFTFDVMIFSVDSFAFRRKVYYHHVSTQGGARMIQFIYDSSDNFSCVKELNANEWSQSHLQGKNIFKIVCKSLFELKCDGTIIF